MMESLSSLLFAAAARDGDRVALVDEQVSLTYAAFASRVEHFAQCMLAAGLRRQDRVAVFMDKSADACALILAALHAGGIAVPINPKLKPQQVRYILENCAAAQLFVTTWRERELGMQLDGLPALRVLRPDTVDAPETPLATHRNIDGDPAAILYTSGSTGHPKGVVVSHRNLVAGCRSVNAYLGTRQDETVLALLPLSFDAGLSQLSTGIAAGARVVLHTPMQAQTVANVVARHEVTSITAVPPLWSMLTQADWTHVDTRSVRRFANTGGHMSESLLAKLRGIFQAAQPFLMYGLTEAFRSTYLPPEEIERRPGSIGKAIPNAEILVLREDGEPCAPDEPGELVHRGALVTLGYWNDPARTAERYRPLPNRQCDGLTPEYAVWSGDVVRRDAEGFLYFIGRRDEMIKTSGYRISPTELEATLGTLPGVHEVAVFGIAAGDIGDAIYATVSPLDTNAEPGALKMRIEAQCRDTLPAYMWPQIVMMRELPRSANGKLDRPALRAHCAHFHDERQR
ncbi:acyl-CoA ligase (AMP-forming), exosortase A system-associated [Burkholderia sp. Bp8963]|uniref:acyl-CoA ligase (AMP-forming), exosortase A system-associated n=1 Tax=Burkholderia sp. Bp8963 TaxID=2184547 RepID=UPI000F5ADDE7|nr:acyl-CoA ligase (AMP-forming), exosortase A system-associated [Burkholderia sp. Bp8963]RQS64124.1 acyl-CoA ligase (AMP-forming), exosortase A system-associated [Burkholderia sp. Bp8963]